LAQTELLLPINPKVSYKSEVLDHVLHELMENKISYLSPMDEQWVSKIRRFFMDRGFLTYRQLEVLLQIIKKYFVVDYTTEMLMRKS
jgi:hypothetical protein